MRYWIFKCNPDEYHIDARLEDAEPKTTWRVTRYKDEIEKGDIAFIWRTGPKNRGICAVLRIESEPQEMPEFEHEQQYCLERDTSARIRIVGRFTNRLHCISYIELKNTPGLENLSVFSGFQQTTNFKVTDEEGKILLNMIGR